MSDYCIEHDRPMSECSRLAMADYGQPLFDNCEREELIYHRPEPGPLYWDWRCLRCSEPVRHHAAWWRRLTRNGR